MSNKKIKFISSINLSILAGTNIIFALVNRFVWRDWNVSIITVTVATVIALTILANNIIYFLKPE